MDPVGAPSWTLFHQPRSRRAPDPEVFRADGSLRSALLSSRTYGCTWIILGTDVLPVKFSSPPYVAVTT